MWIDHELGIGAHNAAGGGAGTDSGNYGVANINSSDMDVDHANAAAAGESDWGGGHNAFPDMFVDGPEESVFPSFVLSAPDPVAGAPPLMEVEEVCRLFDQQEGLVSDGPMSLVRYTVTYSTQNGYAR